jgi:hypothetical protein
MKPALDSTTDPVRGCEIKDVVYFRLEKKSRYYPMFLDRHGKTNDRIK